MLEYHGMKLHCSFLCASHPRVLMHGTLVYSFLFFLGDVCLFCEVVHRMVSGERVVKSHLGAFNSLSGNESLTHSHSLGSVSLQ